MRTTVEMKPEHRAALLALAATRGQKGFSGILGEAIDVYLSEQSGRNERKKELLSLAGSMSKEDSDELRKITQSIRESWR